MMRKITLWSMGFCYGLAVLFGTASLVTPPSELPPPPGDQAHPRAPDLASTRT